MARPVRVSVPLEEDELRKRGYFVGNLLGEGSYAKVKWAFSENLRRRVAMKIINKKRAPIDFQQKFLPRELETMKLLNHPNIIKLYDVIYIKDKIVMVMEMAGHGDLLEYVRLRGALTEDKARFMFSQLVSAIDYMHSFNVVHRDLKCENILLDVYNNVKLSDFSFARIQTVDQLSRTYCGSAAYASPEVLLGIPYHGSNYDIWSLGVILYIMVCGSMPYDDTDVKKMVKHQTERKVGFSRHKKISADVKALIHGILEAKIDERFSISDVRESAWITAATTTTPDRASSKPPPPATTTTNITTATTTTTSADDGLHDSTLSADGQHQSDNSTRPVTADGEPVDIDDSDRRPAAPVSDDVDESTATALSRVVAQGTAVTPDPGVTVSHRRRAAADSGLPRLARARRGDEAAPTSQRWTPAFLVRDRVRAIGR